MGSRTDLAITLDHVRHILATPRPPARDEFYCRLPVKGRLKSLRSPLDLAILATLHWRALRGQEALFRPKKNFAGFCPRAVQKAVLRLQTAGFVERTGTYTFRAIREQDGALAPAVRASFLGHLREDPRAEMALAVRFVLHLALGGGSGKRALKAGLGCSDAAALALAGLVDRRGKLPQQCQDAALSLRRPGPNRSPPPPEMWPESFTQNDGDPVMDPIDRSTNEPAEKREIDFLVDKSKRILGDPETQRLLRALRRVWSTGGSGTHTPLSFLRHGLDVYLGVEKPGDIQNLGGYLTRGLIGRGPESPAPRLEARLCELAAQERSREQEAAQERRRERQEAEVLAEADQLMARMRQLHPDLDQWPIHLQLELWTSLGSEPLKALDHHDAAAWRERANRAGPSPASSP